MRKTHPDGRGLLQFLEAAGVLESSQRKVVIDRVTALDEPEGRRAGQTHCADGALEPGQQMYPLILGECFASGRPGALR
jgi:hypothetical protein